MRTDTEATVELWQEQAMHNLQAAEDFKLELADARRDICELEKQLTSERALADRLAEELEKLAWLAGHEVPNEAEKALTAWKEARSERR